MRQMPEGTAIVRLAGLDADCLEQHSRGDVMRMGNEGDGHPGTDGFVRCMHAPRVVAGAESEDEGAGEG
jgi:hypothetical protein